MGNVQDQGYPALSSPLFPGRATSSILGNGRKRCLAPNREGGMVIHRHETLDARKSFYICAPDELREEVPSPGFFLIRTALACFSPGHRGCPSSVL